ncbi:P-loop ATPase, Sll1717 family [Rhodococcus sp. As11]|uniref:P-loop ATPase, Sll1717 family n=1 Tax=Rhodococcus sp. As11 TaxID=3029189 RepID=UPI003B7B8AC3
MSRPLTALDFGRLDAESDPNLLDYFLETGVIRGLVARGNHLVVGRKGTGKTALFRHLAANLKSSEVVELDLMEYVFELHKGIVDKGVPQSLAYTTSWKLLIYTAMYLKLRGRMISGDVKKGDEALAKIGLGPNSAGLKGIVHWFKRVKRMDLPALEGIFSGGGLELDSPEQGFLSMETAEAIDILESLLVEAIRTTPTTVLIDRLDDAWDGSDSSRNIIGGAIKATRDVYIALGRPSPAPVISFLRTDLWEKVSFNDKNKMSQDTVYLDWSEDQLSDVVDLRIQRSVESPAGRGWEEAFTTAEMRNRASAKKYILKRTLGRPRDAIAFAIYSAQERSDESLPIAPEDIYNAESRYSKHVLDELKDELDYHVADFTAIVNSLKALRTRSFTIDRWKEVTAANNLSEGQAMSALEQLFEASAVGMHSTGGSTGGSRTVYRYQDRHLRSLESETHQVHLALVKELGLRDR